MFTCMIVMVDDNIQSIKRSEMLAVIIIERGSC
jgi:hypothetical protein